MNIMLILRNYQRNAIIFIMGHHPGKEQYQGKKNNNTADQISIGITNCLGEVPYKNHAQAYPDIQGGEQGRISSSPAVRLNQFYSRMSDSLPPKT